MGKVMGGFDDLLQIMLMVYVDDFKMSGPVKNLDKGWKLLRSGIDMDDPYPLDRCLGCIHHIRSGVVNHKNVQIIEYDVCDFMQQCVHAYKNACGEPDMQLRKVDTPFLPSPEGGGYAPAPLQEGEPTGALQPIACSILMKVFYGARAVFRDLLKAVQLLASRVTKWSRDCDRALHR